MRYEPDDDSLHVSVDDAPVPNGTRESEVVAVCQFSLDGRLLGFRIPAISKLVARESSEERANAEFDSEVAYQRRFWDEQPSAPQTLAPPFDATTLPTFDLSQEEWNQYHEILTSLRESEPR